MQRISRLSIRTGALALMLALSAHVAQAQFTGPGAQATPENVAAIVKNPVDDQKVRLQGFILRKVAHEKYIFSDGTAEIRVEIDDDKFPPQPITEKTKVEIDGEVEKDFMESVEIEVDFLRIVN